MSFCTFSKDNIKSGKTYVDNQFIIHFMPDAPTDAVKVYLYGLYLCQNAEDGASSVKAFAEALEMDVNTVIDYFKYWDEFGVLSITSQEPFSVSYYPLNESTLRYRRLNPEKYEEFSKAVQSIITGRMISVTEYNEYYNLLENTSLKTDAFIMLIRYCADLKGNDIGYKYITTVAKDFISRGVTTPELIEKELEGYFVSTSEIGEVFKALKSKKSPEIEDMQAYKRWTDKLGFEHSFILAVIKISKSKTIKKLDKALEELYSNKCFTEVDAKAYFARKNDMFELSAKITKALGLYIEVLDNVLETYVSPWLSKGFNGETLLFVANYCFKKNKRSLELMNDTISNLYKLGLITVQSITLYLEKYHKNDGFIAQFLSYAGVERKPNNWDRECLETWRTWGFTDDMILEASKLSTNTTRPVAYINTILSNWKSQGVFNVSQIPKNTTSNKNKENKSSHFKNERTYTTEELDELLKSFEDFEV
ncbi:MAG: DnaD domain protein [Clostridia bacterium]|nr:DnaD domain protein [Clostridia bacterium]